MLGPLTRISPSSAILTSQPGNGLPTVPNLKSSAVAIVAAVEVSVMPQPSSDEHAGRVEEAQDLRVDRGGAGDGELDPPAEQVADLRQHLLVGDLVLAAQEEAGLLPARSVSRILRPTPTAQLKTAFFIPPAFSAAGRGCRVDLLEDPGHRREVGRLDLGEVGHDLQRVALPVGGRRAQRHGAELDQQCEGVGQRQVEVGELVVAESADVEDHVEHRRGSCRARSRSPSAGRSCPTCR